ncbi:MAG: sigma-70 family RNA polymerase sigma factor [Myxococcales bacterium]|nr:sigma-70 family RNA polymerase sigma factor [Myxococcales bacterium]
MRDDSDLLSAWREGDQDAARVLFDRHFPAVSRFFANKVGRDADDLIQRTFEALVVGRDRITVKASFRSYLFGIAHNILRGHIRTIARDRCVDELSSSVHALGLHPELLIGGHEEQRLILEGLRRLPLDGQILLELYYWEELTVSELAGVLKVAPGTIKSRLNRTRSRLKQILEQLTRSRALLESTTTRLDDWAVQLRGQLHGRERSSA